MKGYQQNSNKPATWQTDLAEAHLLEDNLANIFKNEFQGEVIQAPKDSSFTAYDILLNLDNEDFTFEVKQDKNVHWSGNIAVELARTVNNEYRPTGISATEADVFVYYFNKTYYLIHTQDLRQLIIKAYKTKGGDGGRAHIALVPKDIFLSKAINLNNFLDDKS